MARPIKKRENRRHTVRLTPEAELTLREIRKKSQAFELGNFVSQTIINAVHLPEKDRILEELRAAQAVMKRDAERHEIRIRILAAKLAEIKEREALLEAKAIV